MFVNFLLVPSMVNEFSGGNGVSALSEGSEFCGCWGRCAINNESLKMVRDGDRREEEFPWGVYPSRWAVGWVVLAGDKDCMCRDEIGRAVDQEGVDELEHLVNEFVPVSAPPPAFDDAGVVAIDRDVLWAVNAAREGAQKELESHCLCPCNVSLAIECLPTWDESPGSPSLADDDSNTDARASI